MAVGVATSATHAATGVAGAAAGMAGTAAGTAAAAGAVYAQRELIGQAVSKTMLSERGGYPKGLTDMLILLTFPLRPLST